MRIKALQGHRSPDLEIRSVGDVYECADAFALEMIAAGKAERYIGRRRRSGKNKRGESVERPAEVKTE